MARLGTSLLLSVCLILGAAPRTGQTASLAVGSYAQEAAPGGVEYIFGPEDDGDEALLICEIQGPGLNSPYEGEIVTTQANVVTVPTPNGFFMQMPESDPACDPAASLGLFVFTGSNTYPNVEVGDEVTVEGEVQEFFDWTQIGANVSFAVTASDQPLPAPVVFDVTTPSPEPSDVPELESYESMLIHFENAIATGPTNRHGVFHVDTGGELTPERTFRGPGATYPGLDEGPDLPVWDGNPQLFAIEGGDIYDPIEKDVPRGASIVEARGVLTFRFGEYRLWPTELTIGEMPEVTRPVRQRENNEFIVATLNLWDLFESDSQVPATDLQTKLDKLSLHIREVMNAPEIIGIQEAGSPEALEALADRLNEDDPNLGYSAYADTDTNDPRQVRVGFLYRSSLDVDAFTTLGRDETMPGSTLPLHDRPPLLLEGTLETATGPFPISVLVVHNRSRIGVEEGDNVAFAREKRFEQSKSIATMVQDIQEERPDVRLVVLGDFNDFEFSDSIVDVVQQITGTIVLGRQLYEEDPFVDPVLANQVLAIPAEDRYSYIFEGSAQVLDHILTSHGLEAFPMEAQYARANADAPYTSASDGDSPNRSSDHDGMVLFISPHEPECPFPQITEGDIDSEERTVPVTVEDAAGIEYVNFTDPDDNPHLENLHVLEAPDGFVPDEDSVRFAAEDGELPSQALFVLQSTEMDPLVPVEASYFVTVRNGCDATISLDPRVHFEEKSETEVVLEQNYPNPFTTITTVRYSLPERSAVTLRIYDVLGRRVTTLVDDEVEAGAHIVTWDGSDQSGRPAGSGTYLYRLETDEVVESKSMTLVR